MSCIKKFILNKKQRLQCKLFGKKNYDYFTKEYIRYDENNTYYKNFEFFDNEPILNKHPKKRKTNRK